MKLRYLLLLLFCAISTFAGQAFAYNCRFTANHTITLPDFWTGNQVVDVAGGYRIPEPTTNISPESVPLFSGMSKVIYCAGSGNDNVVELSPPTAGMMDTYTATYSGGSVAGLLKTNVPGIVYTYEVRCTGNCASNNQLFLDLPPLGGTSESTAFSGGYQESEPNWNVYFTLYQTPQYRPHPGQTQVRAIGGTIGTLKMGTLSSNSITINVSSNSVLFTLREPTCQNYGVNGDAWSRTVDFGDFYTSDFDSTDITERRNFTLDFFNCSMNKITLALNGPHDASGDYLTNGNNGTAEGIGLRLAAQINNNWDAVKFDGTTIGEDFSGNYNWWYETLSIPFAGQLKKLGTVKAGTFEAVTTITVTYE